MADPDPQFESAAQCSMQQLRNRTTFSWSIVLSSTVFLAERYEIQNNLLYIQLMNRAQTETLAFYQVIQAWQNSLQQASEIPPKKMEINSSSWKAVHLGICQNTSTPSSKQKSQLSENTAFLRVRTPQKKKNCFQQKMNATTFQNSFPVPARKDPCLCSSASTVIQQSTFWNHQPTKFHQNQTVSYGTYLTLKSLWRLLTVWAFLNLKFHL